MAQDSDKKLDLANTADAEVDLDTNPTQSKPETVKDEPSSTTASKPSLQAQLSTLLDHLKKYSSIIVTLIIGGGLVYVFFSVTTIIQGSDDPTYRQEQSEGSIRGTFDRQTIDKINQLRSRDDSGSINLPSGRISPFIE